jgi:hypothetical protein
MQGDLLTPLCILVPGSQGLPLLYIDHHRPSFPISGVDRDGDIQTSCEMLNVKPSQPDCIMTLLFMTARMPTGYVWS